MKETKSNLVIYLLAINASAQIAMASECQAIVDELPQHIISNNKISNALIDMWVSLTRTTIREQLNDFLHGLF